MSEDCKTIEKEAKKLEKKDPSAAVESYQKAAQCYSSSDKEKNSNACYEKAARILREQAREKEDPFGARKLFTQAIELYKKAGKDSEEEKVISDDKKKFIERAKALKQEAKKIPPEEAEKNLKIASEYANEGDEKDLANECWIDSGDKFREKANDTENPREALEIFKHAIQNYKSGLADGIVKDTYKDAADKFSKNGKDIEKSKKDLVLAIDAYVQASILYKASGEEGESTDLDEKVQDLCEFIGLDLGSIKSFLEHKGLLSITL